MSGVTINYTDPIVGTVLTNVDYTSKETIQEYNRIMQIVVDGYKGQATAEELAQALKDLEKLLKEGANNEGITSDMYTKVHNLIAMLQTAGISIGDPSSVNATTIANWQNIDSVNLTDDGKDVGSLNADIFITMTTLEETEGATTSVFQKLISLMFEGVFSGIQDKQALQADFLELLGTDYEFYAQMQEQYANVKYNKTIPKDPSEGAPKTVEEFNAMFPTDSAARDAAIQKLIADLNALATEDDDFEISLEDLGRPASSQDDDYSAEFPGVEIDEEFKLGSLFYKLYYSDNPQLAIDLLFKQEQWVDGDLEEIWDDDELAQIFKLFSEAAIEANGGVDTIEVNPTAERTEEQLRAEKQWLADQIAKYEDPKFSGDNSPTSNDLIQVYKDRIALIDKALYEDPANPGAYLAEGGAGAEENQRNLNDWNTAMGAMSSDALAKGQKLQADFDAWMDFYMTILKDLLSVGKAATRST